MVFPYFFCFPNFYRSPPLHSPQKRSQKLWHRGTSKPKRLKTPAVLKKGIGSFKMGGRLAGYSYEYHWKILKIGWILFSVGLTQKWCWLKCFNQQDFFFDLIIKMGLYPKILRFIIFPIEIGSVSPCLDKTQTMLGWRIEPDMGTKPGEYQWVFGCRTSIFWRFP
jgi:hypothetical protein